MKLLGTSEKKKIQIKMIKNILVCYNIVKKYYQQDSKVLYTFVQNNPFVLLFEIYLTNFIFKDI